MVKEEFELEDTKELLKRAKLGEENAIKYILKIYERMIMKYSSSIFIKGFEHEDILQMCNIVVIKCIYNFDINRNTKFSTYVFYAVKKTLNYLIRTTSKGGFEKSIEQLEEEGISFIDDKNNIEDEFIKKQLIGELLKNLHKLPVQERDVLIQYYFKGKSLIQYSIDSKVNYKTVLVRKKRALDKMKKYMKEQKL